MRKKTLYIHAGIFKTGSTYLQSTLRHNRDNLFENGVYYPKISKRESTGYFDVTTGNGAKPFSRPDKFQKYLSRLVKSDRSVLLSGEAIFTNLVNNDLTGVLFEFFESSSFEEMKFIFFARDPIDQASSVWAENVTQHGFATSLEEWFHQAENIPCLAQCLETLRSAAKADITVINYSARKKQILEDFSEWLDVKLTEDRSRSQLGTVNRSLTAGEQELLLSINRACGAQAAFLGIELCSKLTDIQGELRYPSKAAQRALLENLRPHIDTINSFLPEDQKLNEEVKPESKPQSDFTFLKKQLDLVGALLGGEINRLNVELDKAVAERDRATERSRLLSLPRLESVRNVLSQKRK